MKAMAYHTYSLPVTALTVAVCTFVFIFGLLYRAFHEVATFLDRHTIAQLRGLASILN
jgi:hypothetical protein